MKPSRIRRPVFLGYLALLLGSSCVHSERVAPGQPEDLPKQGGWRAHVRGSCASDVVCTEHYLPFEGLVETRRKACEEQGHEWSTMACSPHGLIGRCVFDVHPATGVKQIHYYYEDTPREIIDQCSKGEGVEKGRFVPPPP